jgi:hypothetical protein
MSQHGKVVGDDQHGEVVLLFHADQQVDDLGLDGDIQGRYRLVGNDQARAAASALAMPMRWR